jgi:hypothetical protein
MHDHEKSDRSVLPVKPPNNPTVVGAEVVEGRGLPEGNTAGETRPGRGAALGVSSDLDRVRRVARKDRDVRFTALLHHVSVDRCGRRIGRSARTPPQGSTGLGGGTTGWISKRTFAICTPGFREGRIERCPLGGCSYRRRTGGFGRSGSPGWRTRPSSGRWSRC